MFLILYSVDNLSCYLLKKFWLANYFSRFGQGLWHGGRGSQREKLSLKNEIIMAYMQPNRSFLTCSAFLFHLFYITSMQYFFLFPWHLHLFLISLFRRKTKNKRKKIFEKAKSIFKVANSLRVQPLQFSKKIQEVQ